MTAGIAVSGLKPSKSLIFMPTRILPKSFPAIIRTLTIARDEYLLVTSPTARAISAEQFAKLDAANPASLLSRLLAAASGLNTALATQAPVSEQLAEVFERLAVHVSHFHQVLDLGIARGEFAGGARSYYHREVSATAVPDVSTHAAVAEAAEHVVNGEAARQTAEGAAFIAMSHPTAAQVDALRTEFATLRTQGDTAQVNTGERRDELWTFFDEAQALAVDLCDTVEFFYRKDPDAASRRVKCQRWGVTYL